MPFKTATKGMATGVGMLILSLVVIAGVVLGGWAAGWWFKEQNTQRQDQVYDQSYGRQQALKSNITKNIALVHEITAQIDTSGPDMEATLRAQRKATVAFVCADAAKINTSNPLSGDLAVFVDQNCEAGSVSPSSTYFK